ncbi:OB-fold nucleic acid binding domain-containing protein [Hephaestia caeni]|uniref:OB-fold nucleic acid binding domain-containing protein n=1 Tax=Hephaestia caeni TaxID=645617 RepID=UPI003CCC764F
MRKQIIAASQCNASGSIVIAADGREVVEDYRMTQLSLRGQPVSFLRSQLDAMKMVRCADLPIIRDGRNVEVAGVILVRQRPGSAKGVLFVTIEDETGIANGILWPDRFEIYRRQVMSASMIAMRGRLQKEVIHIICDRITDHDAMLRSITRMDFAVAPGRGEGVKIGGGPDPRGSTWAPRGPGLHLVVVLATRPSSPPSRTAPRAGAPWDDRRHAGADRSAGPRIPCAGTPAFPAPGRLPLGMPAAPLRASPPPRSLIDRKSLPPLGPD